MIYTLKKDGVPKHKATEVNILLERMADTYAMAYSWEHAFKYEGWTIEDSEGNLIEGKK